MILFGVAGMYVCACVQGVGIGVEVVGIAAGDRVQDMTIGAKEP